VLASKEQMSPETEITQPQPAAAGPEESPTRLSCRFACLSVHTFAGQGFLSKKASRIPAIQLFHFAEQTARFHVIYIRPQDYQRGDLKADDHNPSVKCIFKDR
jgi:hypothetical protein